MFDKGTRESYDRMAAQEVEMARYIRDTISKNEDTKAVYKLLVDMQRAYESRVLLDSGEGKNPNGDRYMVEDFWCNVGEVRGLRWLADKVRAMVKKADEADDASRRKEKA
jgi:hypothetical protein